MAVTAEQFRKAMGSFATGVAIVTIQGEDGKPYGVTVNSLTSVSLSPLLVLVCLDNRLGGLSAFLSNKAFGISLLSEDQAELSTRFAKKGTDRSGDFYFRGENGVPLLKDVLASLECEAVSRYPGGDHTILVAKVRSIHLPQADGGRPLIFYQGAYRRLHL